MVLGDTGLAGPAIESSDPWVLIDGDGLGDRGDNRWSMVGSGGKRSP